MLIYYVVTLSILFQLMTAYLALRLIKITGKQLSWTLIAIAMALQASRRIVTFIRLISGDTITFQVTISEWIALAISVLMLVGVAGFGSFLKKSGTSVRKRKQVEEALKTEQELFLKAFEMSPLPTLLTRLPERTIVKVNSAFEQLFGYTCAEITGRSVDEFDLWADTSEKQRIVNILLKDGRVDDFESMFKTKSGETGYGVFYSETIEEAADKFILTKMLNITDRKQTQRALEDSENKFRKLFEEGPFGMALVNNEFRFISVNPALTNMLGYTESELQNFIFVDITHPEDIEKNLLNVQKLLNQEISVYKTEKRYIRKDGQVIWVSLTVTSNYNREGQFLYNLAIIENISERKAAYEKVLKSEELYRELIEQASDGIFISDEDGRYLDVNSAGCRMLGYTRDEILQKTLYDLTYTTHGMPISLTELRAGKSTIKEREMIRKDGSRIPVEISAKQLANGYFQGMVRNITERKKTEKALQESKAKLETALASMTDAVFISNTTGEFIEFNDAFATFHRFNNKAECAKTLAEYPDFLDVFMDNGELAPIDMWAVPRALRGETVTNAEYTLRRKDTGETWVGSYSFSPIRDKDNLIVGSVVVGRDITNRKIIEKNLIESERLLRESQKIAGLGSYNWNLSTGFWESSEILDEIFGIEADYIRSFQGWKAIIHPDWHKVMNDYIVNDVIGKLQRFDKEYLIVRQNDGLERWVHGIGELEFDANNQPIKLIGTILDITKRKLAEMALYESEEEFRAMIETIPLAIHLTTGKEQVSKYLNQKMVDLFGYTIEDIPTIEQWWPLAYPDENYQKQISEEWNRKVAHAIDNQSNIEPMEVVVTCKDGSKKNISWGYITLGDKNYSFGLDLTERKQGEAEIQKLNTELEQRVIDRTEQLANANKELEAFSYSVSHDLRAPLRGIDGFSLALYEDYYKDLDDTAKDYIERIRTATKKMDGLIDSLLKLARISRIEMNLEKVNLSSIVKGISDGLKESDESRDAEFIIQKNITAWADPNLLKIVFENLLSNAWKFTSKKDKTVIEFGANTKDSKKTYYVKDNGVGFDMQYVNKLFSAFQRLHSEKDYSGTGVGLTTVQRIIRRHNGDIRVESKLNEGTTFYFTL